MTPIAVASIVNPTAIYTYIDKIQVWLKQPLSRAEITWLRGQCRGHLHVRNKTARFDPSYQHFMILRQPSYEALQSLATVDGLLFNNFECALDWIFDDEEALQAAFDFVSRYHVKKHHRDQGIRFVKHVTRYSGPRSAPNVLAIYFDKHSKVTGEVHCVHLDWRIKGVAALRAAHIHSIGDLLDFDHRQFWSKRLLFYDLDRRHLGRMHVNHFRGTTRHAPWIYRSGRFAYDVHLRAGQIIVRALGSTQAVIDQLRKLFNVRRCLVPIEGSHLLPRHIPY